MKKEQQLCSMVGRRSPSSSSCALGAKSSGKAVCAFTPIENSNFSSTCASTIAATTTNDAVGEESVVYVKARVMTRSDEGWGAVDRGGPSDVGVFRRCIHVPIAPASGTHTQTRSRSSKEKDSDGSSWRPSASEKASLKKDVADEPDSAIECSVADDDKLGDNTGKVLCYDCTEFRIRAERDGNEMLNYVMNKDLTYHQPQPLFHYWRCVCEACSAGAGGAHTHRSLLSNQSSTNSSFGGWSTRASNNYVNLPSKSRLVKNSSVDSTSVNAPSSVTGSSSSGFGSNSMQQHLVSSLTHNHGSFGLTFESSADARAFDAAFRLALKTLDAEAKADAVRICIYPVAATTNSPCGTTQPAGGSPSCTSQNQAVSSALPGSKTQTTNTGEPQATVGRKQSSPNVLDATDRCGTHQAVVKTYSDPPMPVTNAYAQPTSNCPPEAGSAKHFGTGSVKQHDTGRSNAEEYDCVWDPAVKVVGRSNASATCASNSFLIGVTDLEFNSSRQPRGSPTEPTTSYVQLSSCTSKSGGPRQLDAETKRSSSLSRLNHFGVRAPYTNIPYTNTNIQIAGEVGRPSQLVLAASRRFTQSTCAQDAANANLYVCSSYPHLAPNSVQHQLQQTHSGVRSSPSNCGAGVPKTDAGSPRFLKLFRSKKRGSRGDTASISSVSGVSQSMLTNVLQAPGSAVSAARRSSKNSNSRRSTATRQPAMTRARCVKCQQSYYLERNRRGACGVPPVAAQRCVRSTPYFRFVDTCLHSVLDSDDSDTDFFDDDRVRSSHSHSSARSSAVHEREDSGISTFSTNMSQRRLRGVDDPLTGNRDIGYTCAEDRECETQTTCCCIPNSESRHRKQKRCGRWTLITLLSCLIPCFWCYWPLVCCSTATCTRCVGERHEPMPPSVVADLSVLDHKA